LPPDFPENDGERTAALAEIAEALKLLLPAGVMLIRFDPAWYTQGEGVPPPAIGVPFTRAVRDIQAPSTVLIDLRPPPDEILAQMKSKWRYNIRLAEKKVTVEDCTVDISAAQSSDDKLSVFYTLLRETAKRDGIFSHSIDYYRTLFKIAEKYSSAKGGTPVVKLYLAYLAGGEKPVPVAGIVTLFFGKTATYLYGASSSEHRNVMAPYLLQWRAMKDAKAVGAETYDLFGIPPNDDEAHPMHGLYRFKTGFGGAVIHRPGAYDFPRKPLLAELFRAAEAIRQKLMAL
jgi:lipid II:glycine glycyltransferase (peptidoglycan interpeptide bridge formation enzyme)